MRNKIIPLLLVIVSISLLSIAFAFAQNSTTTQTDLLVIIKQLQEKIESLQAQIVELRTQLEAVQVELKLTTTLIRGMRGDEVKKLQEFLKTNPDIYPEGLVTGYFGPLTEAAVKRLQEKYNIEPVGVVGPKTLTKINELVAQSPVLQFQPEQPSTPTTPITPITPATPATSTITPTPTSTFDFSLSISPTSGSVTQGESTLITVTASLTSGIAQSVSFSLSGLPTGATASFPSLASCSPTCGLITTLATAATTPTGIYSLTVTGTGGGLTRTTTSTLTVTAPTPTPTPTSTITCTDSDGDTNFNVQGSMKYAGQVTYQDYCQLKTPYWPRDEFYKVASCNTEEGCYLIENYCVGDTGNWQGWKCPYGCSNGACLSSPSASLPNILNQMASILNAVGSIFDKLLKILGR